MSALMRACKSGNGDVVRLLVDGGADVNAEPRRSGDTALMCACERGNVYVVRLLVDGGASINHVGDRGTALTRACEGGHLDVFVSVENG